MRARAVELVSDWGVRREGNMQEGYAVGVGAFPLGSLATSACVLLAHLLGSSGDLPRRRPATSYTAGPAGDISLVREAEPPVQDETEACVSMRYVLNFATDARMGEGKRQRAGE